MLQHFENISAPSSQQPALGMNVPIHEPCKEYSLLRAEIDLAMQFVAAQGQYILGPQTRKFERTFAKYLGCSKAVGVGNGSDALYLALLALNIGPGDEVITTPFTFFATSEAIIRTGAKPVFVDIEPNTFNLDPRRLEEAITPRTKALLPVHLFGQACEMQVVLELANQYGLFVVEDCAQAAGATYRGKKVGTLGDAGCFSYFPSKNLGTLGDGGMVTTNNPDIHQGVEMLRRHGSKEKYHHEVLGINSRLDELQAAILSIKLPHLDRWNQLRCRFAQQYDIALSASDLITLPPNSLAAGSNPDSFRDQLSSQLSVCVYHQYTVRIKNREFIQQCLTKAGIGTAIYYPIPLHLQRVHQDLDYRLGDFPNAEQAAEQCLSLPMHPNLDEASVDYVAQNLNSAVYLSQSQAAA